MKTLLATLFILNINTAWAHTGHSNNAFMFAFSVVAIAYIAKPFLSKILKIKSKD